MKKPSISVIVPYYNSKKYISKCINSILNQTFKDFELILVDDGSTDNSYNLCLSYAQKDERIVLLKKENGGQGTARNMGLDIALGDFIGFVDSDDYIQPNMYEIMYNSCIDHNAELSICGYNTFRSDSMSPKPLSDNKLQIFNHSTLMEAYFATSIISGGPCNKLYKKNLFENTRFPLLRMREDYYLMPHILHKVKTAVYVGENLYNWRLRLGSTERSKFSSNHLNAAIESADSNINVIKTFYPDLKKYIVPIYIQTRLDLLKSIIHSNSQNNFQHVYAKLFDEICQKKQDLIINYEDFPNLCKNVKFVCKYPLFFKFKETIMGNLKFFVKRIIALI